MLPQFIRRGGSMNNTELYLSMTSPSSPTDSGVNNVRCVINPLLKRSFSNTIDGNNELIKGGTIINKLSRELTIESITNLLLDFTPLVGLKML